VELIGKGHRDVVGACIIVEAGGRRWTHFTQGGGGYLSSSDRRPVFGWGQNDNIDKLTVVWPSGVEEKLGQLAVDRYQRLNVGSGRPREK
jgi:enediyne biosynthesis protein E4